MPINKTNKNIKHLKNSKYIKQNKNIKNNKKYTTKIN